MIPDFIQIVDFIRSVAGKFSFQFCEYGGGNSKIGKEIA